MGIFDKFKKKNTKPQQAGHTDNDLLEIVNIVSSGDDKILESAGQCIENTAEYYNDHIDNYQSRGLSDTDETPFLQWIGCIDLLIKNHYVCECDWKEDKGEFLYAVNSLRQISALSLEIDSKWLDEAQSVPQWCETLEEKWKKSDCVMAAFDIDSDSYVMFPCKKEELETLSELAAHLGCRIDHVKNM